VEAVMAGKVSETPPLSRWTGGLEGKGWHVTGPNGPDAAAAIQLDKPRERGELPELGATRLVALHHVYGDSSGMQILSAAQARALEDALRLARTGKRGVEHRVSLSGDGSPSGPRRPNYLIAKSFWRD